MQKNIWEFYVDRGGTFTDIIAKSPKNTFHIHKLLSSDQAPVQGIRHILQLPPSQPIPPCIVRMGTTIGTNALLERKGAPTCLVITKGFRHLLEIGYQTRKELFSLDIEKHPTLYECSIEIDERVDASGKVIKPLEEEEVWRKLHSVKAANIRSLAIVFMHSYLFPHHELKVKEIAKELGFTCISCSCEVSPQIKIIPRADTTVLNAYLAPTIQNYTSSLQHSFPQASVSLMQSSGGLVSAQKFQGKDSLLSGPAGGVVAVAEISKSLGFPKVIGFDMGGTSTDVSRFDGEYEMTYESEKAGLFLKTPMLHIETVAAGGGSIIHFDGMKLQVGPQSAGANPGPICYGKGGQHPTLTDANLLLGRIDPKYFPAFPLQKQPVQEAFANLAKEIQQSTQRPITAEQVALGAIEVANNHMAEAIKVISVSRGYDPREYALCAFGGAAGQHICAIARLLRIPKIIIHPFASLFSALGMGL
ncbi:MAG: hydantoinase/oxoprolinase family protein, partial [Planctomycetota bacterium]